MTLWRCVRSLLLTLVVATTARGQHARPKRNSPLKPGPAVSIPQLGDEVPDALRKHPAAKPCDMGNGHTDPCTSLRAGRDHITVAWDGATNRVTYLYSTTLQTDDDIRAGDVLGIEPDSPITPFPAPGAPNRFVTSDWCDTDAELSREALWCAVMVPVRPKSGKVLGFVQSLYLYLPQWDAAPMHRTSTRTGSGR